jgi:glycosyltransferase involved in cell wall biosynthesis
MPGAYSEILGLATYNREKLDILHSTSPLYRVPASYRGKVVTTFYDFAMYRVPELFPRIAGMKTKALYSFMAKKSERIIAVSQSTKKDTVEMLGYPEKNISVVHNGIDSRFFDVAQYDEKKLKDKFGIKDKYILFLGTLEPRKNLTRVIEAFLKFKNSWRGDFNYQLVVAGKKGWLNDEYSQIVEDLGLKREVVFTGYVGGDELKPLYSSSEFFVMPSLYEGFGQTIVEAMACGAPCLVSKVSSIPEIAGDAVYYVNPYDTDGIALALGKLASDKELRENLSAAGREQAKKFSWEKCARETLEVYKSI